MPQMQASARARWCSSSEPQLQCCSSTGPHHLEKPRPVLRVIEGGLRELNSPSAARLLPFRLLRFLVSGATSWRISFRLTRGRCAARLNTLPKGIHQVHNVCRLRPLGSFDWLAFLLLLEQLLERILVLVFELARFKVSSFRFHDMRGELEHILGDLLIGNVVEIVGFVPYLIGISQHDAEQSLAAGFKGNNVLARREHDLSNRHHALLADGFPDDSECLLTDLSVRGNVIGIVQVQFVDLLPRHELVDVDRALALDLDSFELLGIKLDILALADFVALDDICGIDLVAAFRIDLTVLDAIASLLIELVEADLLTF